MGINIRMYWKLRATAFVTGMTVACVLAGPQHAAAVDLEHASPESVGLSTTRLQRLDDAMQTEIDAGRKAGIVVLIARRGKIVHHKAYGYADLEKKVPLRKDAYFRLYSMTKPIVSVALLMLFEEGKFQLSDPLEKYIPAMKGVKVYAGKDEAGNMVLEPPKRKITIQDVFRHTAGFSYGRPHGPMPSVNPRVEQAYADAGMTYEKLDSVREVVEDKLPSLPLLYHPGERWVYSFAHDVQAYLVEHFSGMSIDQFLEEHIFEPLGMQDSYYGNPRGGEGRRPVVYSSDGSHHLKADPAGLSYNRLSEHPMGGIGLTMTPMDYAKFAQMLLNKGALNGTRLLGRKTVELMASNHLSEGQATLLPGFGYGLGVAVCTDPVEWANLGSVGQFGWGGAATTWVAIDPKEELVTLLFAQYVPIDLEFLRKFQTLAYQAIVD